MSSTQSLPRDCVPSGWKFDHFTSAISSANRGDAVRRDPRLLVCRPLSLDSRLVTTVVSEPQMDYRKIVHAAAALEKQIGRYRQMTGEQRLSIALELHELSCDVAREGIRRANPGADTAEVERLLHRRLELARAR
jgi:hypothetical protein